MVSPAQTTEVKDAMRAFYASEAGDRDSDEWLRQGGTARVPEPKAAHYFIDRKVETAVALAGAPAQSRVLEVGCSFGHMTFLLTQRFREVVAVDISPESIALASRRADHYGVGNVRFLEADAERLEAFRAGEFDAVLSFSTLRFCPHPEAALDEMFRVAAPGARVVVDVPNRNCPWYGPIKRGIGLEAHIHDRLFDRREIETLMRGAGFEGVVTRHILFTSKRMPSALLPISRLMDRVLEPLPGIRGLSGIIMAGGRKPASR
jgi:ubiquinone/menaquinone biosynthesis C-methylase UbiE